MSLSCKYLGSTDAGDCAPLGPLATTHEWHRDSGWPLGSDSLPLTGQLRLTTDLKLFKDFNNQLFTQSVPVFYFMRQWDHISNKTRRKRRRPRGSELDRPSAAPAPVSSAQGCQLDAQLQEGSV